MSACAALLDRLVGLGFEVGLGEHGTLIVRPASSLTDELRQAIRDQRDGLVAVLADPDPRVTCNRCSNYRASTHRCVNFRLAGLAMPDIAPELAALKQHCHGYAPT